MDFFLLVSIFKKITMPAYLNLIEILFLQKLFVNSNCCELHYIGLKYFTQIKE